MRVLVVEDEPRLARALQRGLAAEGYVVDLAADGPTGLEAARSVRVPDRANPAGRAQLGTGADAVRQGRRVRPGGRAGLRCRRLPDQAVLLRGTAGQAAGAAAPGCAGTPRRAGRRRADPRS